MRFLLFLSVRNVGSFNKDTRISIKAAEMRTLLVRVNGNFLQPLTGG